VKTCNNEDISETVFEGIVIASIVYVFALVASNIDYSQFVI